jgi:ATP-dependent DNA helicase RecG
MFKIGATEQVNTEVEKLVALISGEHSSKELKEKLVLKNEEYFRKQFRNPAIEKGLIEMTIPEKPKSSKQKYKLTEKGRALRKG